MGSSTSCRECLHLVLDVQDFLLFTFSSGVAETLNALLDETFQFFEELGYGVPEAAAEVLPR